MDTWFFWGFALVSIVSSLLVVGQRQVARGVVMLAVLLGATGGLYVLLSAPLVAVLQIGMYAAAVLALVLPSTLWLDVPDDADDRAQPAAGSGVRRFGVVLSAVLLMELAWAFQRLRGASLPAAGVSTDTGPVAVIVTALTTQPAGSAMVVLLVLVAAVGVVVLVRREIHY